MGKKDGPFLIFFLYFYYYCFRLPSDDLPHPNPLTPPFLPLFSFNCRVPRSADWPPSPSQDPPLAPPLEATLASSSSSSSSWLYDYSLSSFFFRIWVCSWLLGSALWIGLGAVASFRRMRHCAARTGAGRFSRLVYWGGCCWWNLYIWGGSLSLPFSFLFFW